MEFLLIVLWYIIGCWGFYFWWTTEHTMSNFDIFIMLLAGVIGPLSWVVGHVIHSK